MQAKEQFATPTYDATGLSINTLRRLMGVPTVDSPVPAEV